MDLNQTNQALDRIFQAASVAVVGASADPAKLGFMTLDSIIKGGFQGPIYPVNPKAQEILGLKAYPSLTEIPGPVDLAVIIVPARFVAAVIREAGRAGIPGAVVLTAGFREAGQDDLEEELARAANEAGVRFVGPNVQGINYLPNRLCAMFFPVITQQGPLTVITQSGSATAGLSEWAVRDGLGITAAVNLGNQTDLTLADYLNWFAKEETGGALSLYVEGVDRERKFLKSALAVASQKPLALLKSGRSEAGRQAAASHTGALAGSHQVFSAACRQIGAIAAEDIESLYDRAKGLAAIKPPKGDRLLSISTSGGMGGLAADQAEAEGLRLPPLPEEFIAALREENLSPLANMANPLDLGYIEMEAFRRAALLADELDVADVILLNLGDPMPGAVEAAKELSRTLKAGLAVSYLGGGAEEEAARPALGRAGVAVFPSPERAVKGIGAAVADAAFRRARQGSAAPALANWSRPNRPADHSHARMLSEPEAAELISAYGLAYPEHVLAATGEETARAVARLGGPVVLKIVSPAVSHKTEIGGVITGVETPEAAQAGFNTLARRLEEHLPGAEMTGALVCRQAAQGLEVIIGGLEDPVFGPTVMFGLGGIQAEALADVTFRLAPLERIDAEEMIREIKGFSLLQGWRGAPPVDLDALAQALMAVSRLLTERDDIFELDLNPVRVFETGLMVLDARIAAAGSRETKENHG